MLLKDQQWVQGGCALNLTNACIGLRGIVHTQMPSKVDESQTPADARCVIGET